MENKKLTIILLMILSIILLLLFLLNSSSLLRMGGCAVDEIGFDEQFIEQSKADISLPKIEEDKTSTKNEVLKEKVVSKKLVKESTKNKNLKKKSQTVKKVEPKKAKPKKVEPKKAKPKKVEPKKVEPKRMIEEYNDDVEEDDEEAEEEIRNYEVKSGDKFVNKSGFVPFYVYKELGNISNHFYPAEAIGNKDAIVINQSCLSTKVEGLTSISVQYMPDKPGDNWTCIYWTQPANNWGNFGLGYNLKGALRVSFWARGEMGGEVVSQFTIGGIQGGAVEDSDTRTIGPITLTNDWKQYFIDLTGANLKNIIGGFSFTVSADDNPKGCVFYLDSIKYE